MPFWFKDSEGFSDYWPAYLDKELIYTQKMHIYLPFSWVAIWFPCKYCGG